MEAEYDLERPRNYPNCDPHYEEPTLDDPSLDPHYDPYLDDPFTEPHYDPYLDLPPREPCNIVDIDGKPFWEDYIELADEAYWDNTPKAWRNGYVWGEW